MWSAWWKKRKPARPVSSRPARRALAVEALEDRLTPAAAALDLTFAGDGQQIIDHASDGSVATAVQGDKVLVAGSTGGQITLARFDADGSPDTSFHEGVLIFALSDHATIRCMAIQADGKILLGGHLGQGQFQGLVIRLNADGSLDSSFDLDGIVIFTFQRGGHAGAPFEVMRSDAHSIAVQADGKIVVGGDALARHDFHLRFGLARLNSDGSYDTGFGFGGRTDYLSSSVSTSFGASVTVQPDDGKIVLTASMRVARTGVDTFDIGVLRFNGDGSLDGGFASGSPLPGVQVINFGGDDFARGVSVQGDGKIVVAGTANNSDLAVIRLNVDGGFDSSFAGDGIQTIDFGDGQGGNDGHDVQVLADGKVVVVGRAGPGHRTLEGTLGDFGVARLNGDGNLDLTFGIGGKQTIDVHNGSDDTALSVAVQADGKLVVAGTAGGRFALARLSIDNAPPVAAPPDQVPTYLIRQGQGVTFDLPTFTDPDGSPLTYQWDLHNDGVIDFVTGASSLPLSWEQLLAGGVEDGSALGVAIYQVRLLVDDGNGGTATRITTLTVHNRVARAGALDTTFGVNGRVFVSGITGTGLAEQSDGKLIVATGVGAARFHADGSLDAGFGNAGLANLGFVAWGAAVRNDGKIIVTGFKDIVAGNMVAARLNEDGSLDTTFGDDGYTVLGFPDYALSMALQEGKIIMAGYNNDNTTIVVRLNEDGSLDSAFGDDGRVTIHYGGVVPSSDFGGYGVAVQTDGKVVVPGGTLQGAFEGFGFRLTATRLNPDGSLDESFDGDGKRQVPLHNAGYDVAVQPDGKIVMAGVALGGFGLFRLNEDGSFDATFGESGIAAVESGGRSVALQSDGKIVTFGHHLTSGKPGVSRVNADGSLDTTFGNAGTIVLDYKADSDLDPDFGSSPTDVLIQSDGRIVVVSYSAGTGFFLARLEANSTPTFDPAAGDEYTIAENQGVTFSAAGWSDRDGDSLTFSWDIDNDGTYDVTGARAALTSGQLASFGIDRAGVYTITLRADDGKTAGADTIPITLNVLNVARVESVQINDGHRQRSRINKIVITFDGEVTLDPSAFTLLRRTANGPRMQAALSAVWTTEDGKTVVELTFPEGIQGSLRDGRYTLLIDSDRVQSPAGALDGDDDGSSGGDFVFKFHCRFGDSNGNRQVRRGDLRRFNQARRSGYVWYLDRNENGKLDNHDRLSLLSRIAKGIRMS